MPKKKKILIFSPPFGGHLYILKELILKNKSKYNFKLVITGWKNIQPDLGNLKNLTTILAKSNLKETDPCLWTFKRVYELLDDVLSITKKFEPDLIIYDFFSIEGYFAGKILNIPYWSSIPALIGPSENQKYLKSKLSAKTNQKFIKKIEKKLNIKIDKNEIEIISDGLHLPGELNLIWSYPNITPNNFRKNRKKAKYIFLGNPRGENIKPTKIKNKKPTIYFSLGTVVMNNLWNQQKETRKKLTEFISEIARLWNNNNFNVVFVSQGKKILNKYPPNWRVIKKSNQVKELSKADLFVTHGGSNSFHEAILQKVPMIAIPFFGDQPLVAKQIQKLGIGINLVKDKNIDTKKNKKFLNKKLAHKLNKTVIEIPNKKYYEKPLLSNTTQIKSLFNKYL